MCGGVEHFGISEHMGGGGGKIPMPPVVGVWIFSGTTHSFFLVPKERKRWLAV